MPGGEAQPLVPVWRSTWRNDPPLMVSVVHSGTADVDPVTSGLVLLVLAELSLWFMICRYDSLIRCASLWLVARRMMECIKY